MYELPVPKSLNNVTNFLFTIKSNFDDEIRHPWLPKLQKGLHDILFSKIGKSQRDPAMILVAAVIEVSDFEWCLAEVI